MIWLEKVSSCGNQAGISNTTGKQNKSALKYPYCQCRRTKMCPICMELMKGKVLKGLSLEFSLQTISFRVEVNVEIIQFNCLHTAFHIPHLVGSKTRRERKKIEGWLMRSLLLWTIGAQCCRGPQRGVSRLFSIHRKVASSSSLVGWGESEV